ncbi:MAG: hypothetical protein ONB12_12180 [candidate division KSB1 bacterium]|nr:hypothetical protein [candidate division KSB1 bacterium]
MKIVIFNEDLRSEMQMYLALSNLYDVTIADSEDDLLQLLDRGSADYAFVDLDSGEEAENQQKRLEIADRIRKKHPQMKIVGICSDKNRLPEDAARAGIKFVTRPIRNRDLLQVIE